MKLSRSSRRLLIGVVLPMLLAVQGWRLEVPSLPRLAGVGAFRGTPPSIIPLPPHAATNSNSSTTTTASQSHSSSQQQMQQQDEQQLARAADTAAVEVQAQPGAAVDTPSPSAATPEAAAAATASICGRAVPTAAAYHGGYYSMDDVAVVVSYAAERCIEVVPEIELPGHCVAALAAYPHLSCEYVCGCSSRIAAYSWCSLINGLGLVRS